MKLKYAVMMMVMMSLMGCCNCKKRWAYQDKKNNDLDNDDIRILGCLTDLQEMDSKIIEVLWSKP